MLKWLLSISFENSNLCTVTVLLRGGWYMWGGKVYRYHIGGDLHLVQKAG